MLMLQTQTSSSLESLPLRNTKVRSDGTGHLKVSTKALESPRRASAGALLFASPRRLKFEHALPNSKLSEDETTCTISVSDELPDDLDGLRNLIFQQARIPPKPLIRIKGMGADWMGSAKVEFDFQINMASLLTSDLHRTLVHDSRESFGSCDLKNTMQSAELITSWISCFMTETPEQNSLEMRREVNNWDTDYLKSQLTTLIKSEGYAGNVEITFPVTYAKIIIQKSAVPETNLLSNIQSRPILSRLRSSTMDTRSSTVPGRLPNYHVTTTTWSYATASPGTCGRQCAVWTEQDWLQQWQEIILNAVRKRRRGWLGSDEYTEALTSPLHTNQGWARWWQ